MEQDFDPLASHKPASSPQEFGLKERLITTLIFDTQPARKKKFIERLGYEVNPKDDNQIKPKGSDDDSYFPIDPGGMFNFKQYAGKSNKENWSEFGKDLFEGAMDFLQGSMTEGAGVGGAILGGAAGTAIAPGAGTVVGGVAGRTGGRIAMFNAIEKVKDSIGDLFLDEKVPVDYALRATQSAIQGVAPEIIAKGGSAAKNALTKSLSAVSSGVRTMLNIGDGKIGKQAWDAIKANPTMMADETALREASSGIDSTVERLTGLTDAGPDISKSVFQQPLSTLEKVRKAEADRLSQDPNNGARIGDVISFFERKKFELADPNKYPIKSAQRQDGIDYIDGKIKELKALIPKPKSDTELTVIGQSDPRLTFGQIDSIVKEIQSDLYSPKLLTKDWRNAVKTIVDGSPESPGLNNILKAHADRVGSPYSQIKQKQSEIFDAFDGVASNVTREKARRFVMGDELIDPRGTSTDAVARDFTDAIGKADAVLGSNFANDLKTGQIQNQVWSSINSRGSRGSGGSTVPAISAGVGTAATMKMMGAPPELAALGGAAAGAGTWALTQPKLGTSLAIKAEQAAQGADRLGANLGDLAKPRQFLAQEAIQHVPQPSPSPTPEQPFDPLEDFDPLKDFNNGGI